MKKTFGAHQTAQSHQNTVLTIGNFDGLHLGHRKIITKLKEFGQRTQARSLVISFDPHPRQVLFPDKPFKQLFTRTDLAEQLELLGVDELVLEPFTLELSRLEPEQFVRDYIFEPFKPSAVVVGYDFSFGVGRRGTLEILEQVLASYGVELHVVPPLRVHGTIISSTKIRETLIVGNVTLAAEYLGRNYYITGKVVKGDGRGHSIGFPTANLAEVVTVIPMRGVYSGWAYWKGDKLPAVANIGNNPTFANPNQMESKLEVHILDWSHDIYEQDIRFEFVQRLRDEQKFASVGHLVEQIKKDIESARDHLAHS